ncbi:MAG: GTP 3',8-cyclase MoaA [Anaerolineae bacterium]|nr:GTP 3',8-cyclase MoaA [Anaerolineae bacterium]
MVTDRFGRHIRYLRISLTDRCNLRCVYCMPEDMVFRPHAEMMQDDEIITLFRLFVDLGFDKFRLTGGEPTTRANIVELVREMCATPGAGEVSMTTNGILLDKLAKPLAEAGLKRCNISVDTLNPERFRQITRWGRVEDVRQGILAIEEAGLLPIKLNSVVSRGMNDGQDVVDLAALTLEHPWQIRFIEMMPLGGLGDFQQAQIVTEAELRSTIEAQLGPLGMLNGGKLDGEARIYKLKNAQGDLGFISSVSAPFCATCSRVRLTADGRLRLCLLREKEVDLLTPLRQGATRAELQHLILTGIWQKPWGHGLAENDIAANRQMSEIGG